MIFRAEWRNHWALVKVSQYAYPSAVFPFEVLKTPPRNFWHSVQRPIRELLNIPPYFPNARIMELFLTLLLFITYSSLLISSVRLCTRTERAHESFVTHYVNFFHSFKSCFWLVNSNFEELSELDAFARMCLWYYVCKYHDFMFVVFVSDFVYRMHVPVCNIDDVAYDVPKFDI